MIYRHNLWPTPYNELGRKERAKKAEKKRIAKEKRDAKKELRRLTDENGKNLLLDYSGENKCY